MAERREYVVCPRCDGAGGPPDRWDEDTQRWVSFVCSSCGGQGYRQVWHD